MTARSAVLRSNWMRVRDRMAAACARAGRPEASVTLVAVTKSAPLERIRDLYDLGQRALAENRPQALWERAGVLPPDVEWHLIGHLQSNKVRRTLRHVSMIHSIDRTSIAEQVSLEAQRIGRRIPVTIEVNVTGEETKGGFPAQDLEAVFPTLLCMEGLDIRGLMTMARYEEEPERCRPTFVKLRELARRLETVAAPWRSSVLSMGMTNDFEVAIEEGATHVRIGTALFEGCLS